MKKIAFIIKLFQDSSFHGGGEKIFYKLIDKLIENHYFIDIYCSKSTVSEFPGINKITVIDKPYDHLDPVVLENFYNDVKNLISDKDYDYVISENITPPIGITFLQGHSVNYRKNKLKNLFESFLYNFRRVKTQRIKYEKKWMAQGYNRIFTLSNILKNDVIENFNIPEDKVSVVYPGVDIPENDLSTVSSNNPVFTFGLSAPGFKRKGGYIFLKALGILKKKGYDCRARIIYPKSSGNLWVKLLIKIYGIEKNIEFLCFQKNMQEFYSSIDCLVMPSLEETFGLVALEAMTYKKLAIASSNCGASEILKDGHDSFIFNLSGNPSKNLAEKMAFVLDNKNNLDKYIKNGCEAARIYSWDKTYNDFIKELSRL